MIWSLYATREVGEGGFVFEAMQVKGRRDGGDFIFNFQLGKFHENSSVQKCRFT